NGRAASWTTTGSPSPAASSARRTDSDRTAPPATPNVPAGASLTASTGRATTIRATDGTARSASTLHWSIGFPANVTNALGLPDPRRSPRPAATINATAMLLLLLLGRHHDLAVAVRVVGIQQQRVEVLVDLVRGHLKRIHELGTEDL